MFSLKRSIIAVLLFLLFYVLLMVGGDFFLHRQKSTIEKAFEKEFPGVTLSIGRLYNLPFGFLGAKDIVISFGNHNSVSIKQVRFFYLPSVLWDGMEAIYQITIQEADGTIAPNELLAYLESFSQNISSKKMSPKIVIQKSKFLFSFWQTFFATFSLSEAMFRPHPIGWEAAYDGEFQVNDVYTMEYLHGKGSLKLHLYGTHWGETIVQTKLSLSVGGIPISLFTNFSADLSLYRKHHLSQTNTRESLIVNFAEKSLAYSQQLFLNYGKLQEKGIFEYYFSPGRYTLETSWKKAQSSLSFHLQGPEQQFLSLFCNPEGGTLAMSAKKGGKASFTWQCSSQGFSLKGNGTSLMVIPNFLYLSGKTSLQASSRGGFLQIEDLRVNRGRAGNTVIRFQKETNGISFVKESGNLGFDGFIGRDITVNFEGRNIEGTALTTTIWFDGFDLAKMTLATKGRFFMDEKGKISINGKIEGFRLLTGGSCRALADYSIEVLSPTNAITKLSNLSFSKENIRGNITIETSYPNRRWTYVSLAGDGRFPFIGQSPIQLSYTWDALAEKGEGSLNLRQNIQLVFSHHLTDGELEWKISNLSLSLLPLKISKRPVLQSSGILTWNKNTISFLKTSSLLLIEGMPYELRMEGRTKEANFFIDNFWLGLQADTLIGQGQFSPKPEGGELRIGFIRGGGFLIRWDKERWESIIDLKKAGIRLPDKRVFFVEGIGKLTGEGLSFDGEGQIKISDENTIFLVRNLRKEGKRIEAKEIFVDGRGWEITGDGFVDLSTTNAGWSFLLASKEKHLFQLSLIGSLERKDDAYLVTYRIPEWLLTQKKQPALSGEVIIKNSLITFSKKQLYGINGFYDLSTKNLLIEYLLPFLSGNISGEVSEKNINLRSQHRGTLSFLDKWQQIRLSGAFFAKIDLAGNPTSPSLDGNIQLQDLFLSFPGLVTKITNQYLSLTFSGEEIVLPRQKLTTSTGIFWIQGGFKPFQEGFFSLLLGSQRSTDVFRFQSALFTGSVQPEILNLTGNQNGLSLSGNLRLRQSRLWISLQDIWQREKEDFPLPVQLTLTLSFDQKVNVQSELFDFVFEPGASLKVKGNIGNPLLTGKLLVASGNLRYLTQNFQIVEGSITFENDFFPTVELQSKYKYRDFQENIDIYLTFRGKLPKINLVNFYSIPERRQEEIIAYLGLPQVATNTNIAPKTAQALLSTGAGLAEDVLVLSPLSARLRQQLGLDMFVIRSALAQNYAKYLTGSVSNLSWNTLLEGSSVSLGRYILPNIFLEADISLKGMEESNTLRLRPVYSVGISYSFEGFEVGWSYEPLTEPLLPQPLQYEQKIEINYKRRF